jgi:predicted nucleic acid-binding Zn ribbon protein
MVEEVVAEPVEAAVVEEVVEVVEEAGAVEQERYCPVCGSIVHAGDTFCGSCGAVLDEMGTLAEQTTEVVTTEAPIEPAVAVVEPAVAEVMIEEAPVQEAVIEEAPVQEAVIEEAPIQEAVAEEAVVEEVVVAEALIAEQPVVEEQVVEELHCSVCGASVLPDQAFCASCGAALQAVEKVAEAVAPQVALAGPYLEIVESGAHIPLVVQDALLIGRADEISGVQPDVDMTPHRGMEGGVSRRHAQLLHEAGKWFIVDLDSTNGTYLNGAEVQPKARQPLNDGDRIGLGDVEAVFHAG